MFCFHQGVVEASAQRLVSLAKQWEKHRAPLIDEYRTLKEQNASKEVSSYWLSLNKLLY